MRGKIVKRVALLATIVVIALGVGVIWLVTPREDRSQLIAPTDRQQAFGRRVAAAGARDVEVHGRRDGGIALEGTLEGRQFAVAIPPRWNHEALLFAHGYSYVNSSTRVALDPVANDPAFSSMSAPYAEGFAVGHSAYDKPGLGIESATVNTMRLRELLEKAGVSRFYVSGGSMGGSVVMALIERHPGAFVGAISACGVTDGWQTEIGGLVDLRALYNFYTKDTRYALPGDRSLDRNALSLSRPFNSSGLATIQQIIQVMRIARPVTALFDAASANPDGPEAQIIAKISSMSVYRADPTSFLYPLSAIMLGMDDMRATLGGNVYGNTGKRYSSPLLSAAEIAALNQGIQRIKADPVAQAYARDWHESTGRFSTPLVTVHNAVDALVPYSQSTELRRRVAAAGNLGRLSQFEAVPTIATVPVIGVTGLTHCGFTKEQTSHLFSLTRRWVEHGVRPERR